MKVGIAVAIAFCFGLIEVELSTKNRMSMSLVSLVSTTSALMTLKQALSAAVRSASVAPGGIGQGWLRSGAVQAARPLSIPG